MNKSIWLFNQFAITPDMPGGTRHYELFRRAVQKGYRVTIFAAGFNFQARRETKVYGNGIYTTELKGGITFVWIKTFPYQKNNWKRIFNMLSFARRSCKVARRLRRDNIIPAADIIIGSSVHLFAVLTAYRISKQFGARFFMEVRDLWPATLVEFKPKLKYHPVIIFFSILERFLARRAEKLITVLPKAYLYYEKIKIARERIVWIPNGVDPALFSRHNQIIKTGGTKSFIVMYAGILGLESNIETLFRAAEIMKEHKYEIEFVIYGDGERRVFLEKLKEALALEKVKLKDLVPKKDVPAVLAQADALWIGTRNVKNLYKYGFSFNKLFDYLAAGRPLLFSINCDYNPVESAGAGLTVPPEDPKALAEAIIQLLKTPESDRKKMGIKGQAYVKEHHDWDILTERFIQIIENSAE